MIRSVYLDNAATTRVLPEIAAAMAPYLTEQYGNPSSLHGAGRAGRRAVDEAREAVAAAIGAEPTEVVFTGGGTESDNFALFGAARRARREAGRRHVVVSAVEHQAVLNATSALEEDGFEVTAVGVDAAGRVDAAEVEAALTAGTALVSVMLVNNETGVVQPVAEIARRARARGALTHADAVQALGKLPVEVRALGVDLLSVSAHKIHGPKGVGALWVRKGTAIDAVQRGGHHEWGLRAGTENVAGIAGFGAAAARAGRGLAERAARLAATRDRLERAIAERVDRVRINGAGAERAPHITNVSFEGAEGESLLISLDTMGVCVATGSACASDSIEPSHVLTAMGLPLELAQAAVRFSVSEETTAADVDYAVDCVVKAVGRLRDISPLYDRGG